MLVDTGMVFRYASCAMDILAQNYIKLEIYNVYVPDPTTPKLLSFLQSII